MNNKLKTMLEVLAACAIVSLAVYGGANLYSNIINQTQPVLLFTSKLATIGTVTQLTSKLSQTSLTFTNNQTIVLQDYSYVISSLALGSVYKIYECTDGGYRVILDTHST